MAPHFSPVAVAGWSMFGLIAVAILLPGSPTSINVVGTSQNRPIASVAASAVEGHFPVKAVVSNPSLAKLSALVWSHGKRPAQQAATPSMAGIPMNALALATGKSVQVGAAAAALQAPPDASTAVAPPGSPSRTLLIANSGVNVHSSPDNQGANLFILQPGESVEAVATRANWVEVKTGSGATGWVYSKFLVASR